MLTWLEACDAYEASTRVDEISIRANLQWELADIVCVQITCVLVAVQNTDVATHAYWITQSGLRPNISSILQLKNYIDKLVLSVSAWRCGWEGQLCLRASMCNLNHTAIWHRGCNCAGGCPGGGSNRNMDTHVKLWLKIII